MFRKNLIEFSIVVKDRIDRGWRSRVIDRSIPWNNVLYYVDGDQRV